MFGFLKKGLNVYAPMTGKVVDVTEVPDPVFAGKMVGDGVAIIPSEGEVVAPFDGEITQFFETGHAFSISNGEFELLIHVGMDTVELKGDGFTKHKKIGDKVKKGEKILTVELEKVQAAGKSLSSPVILVEHEGKTIEKKLGSCIAGESQIMEFK